MARIKQRDSNFELCRIFCMFYIVAYHLIFHVPSVTKETTWGLAFLSIFHIGVLVFVMISGYYGIKRKLKTFLYLAISVSFYNIIGLIYARMCLNHPINTEDVLSVVLPYSKGNYWFVKSYIVLYLLSPYVNTVLSGLKFRDFNLFLLILGIIVWYGGGIIDDRIGAGKGILAFVLMYSFGRYIKEFGIIVLSQIRGYIAHRKKINEKVLFRLSFSVYLSITALVFILISYSPVLVSKLTYFFFYGYNEIGLYIMAISFFLIFVFLKFKNVYVNWFATATFGVYLIHENTFIGQGLIYPLYDKLFHATIDYNVSFIIHTLFACCILITCSLIDKCRESLFIVAKKLFTKLVCFVY